MKSYWHVSYLIINEENGKDRIKRGFSVVKSDCEYFDFVGYYTKYPTLTILSMREINEVQYNALLDYVKKKNRKDNGDESES